ncbi:MAG: hypothetical protein HGA97_09135 [Chlorobiaceae bacterium]|nr:hypothetical protein [Chlorobiaceae bacterium]
MKFEEIELPSNRKFGLLFAVVFALIAWRTAFKTHLAAVWIFSTLSLLTLIVTILKPDLLLPLNKLWMRIGWLLGKIVSPVVLGIIFFCLFTPLAIVMRLTGRDELLLKKVSKPSYWKERLPLGPEPVSFKEQF